MHKDVSRYCAVKVEIEGERSTTYKRAFSITKLQKGLYLIFIFMQNAALSSYIIKMRFITKIFPLFLCYRSVEKEIQWPSLNQMTDRKD